MSESPDILDFMSPSDEAKALLHPGDKFFVSFPRSGRTWVTTMLAAAILREEGNETEEPAAFERIKPSILPEIDQYVTSAFEKLRQKDRPSAIRSHGWDGIVSPGPSIYLFRRPENSLRSFFRYGCRKGYSDYSRDEFIQGNISWWILHLHEAIDRHTAGGNWMFVSYESFLENPKEKLSRVARHLQLKLSAESIDYAVTLASKNFVISSTSRTYAVETSYGDQAEALSKETTDMIKYSAMPLYEEACAIADHAS